MKKKKKKKKKTEKKTKTKNNKKTTKINTKKKKQTCTFSYGGPAILCAHLFFIHTSMKRKKNQFLIIKKTVMISV